MHSAWGSCEGMVQERGSQKYCNSWTVLHAQCTSALSSGFPLSQGKTDALDRWGGKTKHHLISYFLSNTSAKSYRNRIVYINIIASQRWDVFLRHSVEQSEFRTSSITKSLKSDHGLHRKSFLPLINHTIDHAHLVFSPQLNKLLMHLLCILDSYLVYTLLHHAPDMTIHST